MQKMSELLGKALLNRLIVGGFVLIIVIATLTVDILGWVHPCPFCRTERFALGVLSLILLSKWREHLVARYLACLFGLLGIVVGIMQNFRHIQAINKGEFEWGRLSITHPWIMSGMAVMALVWLLYLILGLPKLLEQNGLHQEK